MGQMWANRAGGDGQLSQFGPVELKGLFPFFTVADFIPWRIGDKTVDPIAVYMAI